jgi:glycerophosphoryl diester phosphodiesterase
VHLSSEGELVVIHDHTLDRTTNGSGLVVQHSLAELRNLDAGNGEQIPLLAEVCELARDRAGLCIETKQLPMPYPGLEEKLVDALRELDMVEQTCVISFHHPSVKRVKEIEPRLLTGVLMASLPIEPVRVLSAASADIYAPHWGATDPQLVEDLHAAGAVVGVWTVDDQPGIAWSRQCRPDSVFTNRPREVMAPLRG